MRTRTFAVALFALLAIAPLGGCDKLKGAVGKGDDAGSSSSGGGLFSFLGSDFEGEITSRITTKAPQKNGPQQVVFGIKKPKYRVDTSSPVSNNPMLAQGGTLLLEPANKKGWLLVHPQKLAIEIDFERLKAMKDIQPRAIPGLPAAPKGAPTAAPTVPPKVDKTGVKNVVAGYECEIWRVTSQDANVRKSADVCVAEGITWIDISDLGWADPELAVAAVATEANRFPLRVITFDAKGVEEMRMEATKVDKKKLDDARFVVPADYRPADMSQLLGGGMPPGMPSFAPPRPKK